MACGAQEAQRQARALAHKQSTPRAGEGLPAGAARLGRAALQNRLFELQDAVVDVEGVRSKRSPVRCLRPPLIGLVREKTHKSTPLATSSKPSRRASSALAQMIGIALVSSISYAAGRAALRGGATHAGRTRMIQSVASAPVSSVLAAEPATHPGFELVKVEMVDEYTIKCATYRHIKSGAELISAQADDDNKVFGIVFRTPVTDSPDTQTHGALTPMPTPLAPTLIPPFALTPPLTSPLTLSR